MKKLILLMPLMALTTLTSCGKSFDPNKIDLYKKSTQYASDGVTVMSTTSYEYNDHDLMSRSVEIDANHDKNIQPKKIKENTYDEHENLIYQKVDEYRDVEETEPYATHTQKRTITYDEQNRISCSEEELISGGIIGKMQEKYEYLDKKKIVKMSEYNPDSQQYVLSVTATYTYNDQGQTTNIRREYAPRQNSTNYGNEEKYTLDEHGCAIKMERYSLDEYYHITENMEYRTTTTYLDNLYYRPLKETRENFSEGILEYTWVVEREYNKDKKITLYREYKLKTGNYDTAGYPKYITYEY